MPRHHHHKHHTTVSIPQTTDKRIVVQMVKKTQAELFSADQTTQWASSMTGVLGNSGVQSENEFIIQKLRTINILDITYPFQLGGYIDETSFLSFVHGINNLVIQHQKVTNDVVSENQAKLKARKASEWSCCCMCISASTILKDNEELATFSPEQLLRMNEAFDAIKRYSDSFGRDISASGVHLVNENGFYIFCLPEVSQGPVY
jgi:hypothetical protein